MYKRQRIVHNSDYDFEIGKAEILRDGGDVSIIACGIMVKAALEAADTLAKENIECRVINMATIQPIDTASITNAAKDTGAIVTAEEHLQHGGLGSVVAQVTGHPHPVPLESVALENYAESGNPDELLVKYGLTSTEIVDRARRANLRKP